MSIRPPGVLLSLLSILWMATGCVGVYVLFKGSYVIGLLAILLGVLSAGLWLQWSFVRIPLVIYLLAIGVSGVGLLLLRSFDAITALRAFAFLYFAYLVYRWQPSTPSVEAEDGVASTAG